MEKVKYKYIEIALGFPRLPHEKWVCIRFAVGLRVSWYSKLKINRRKG